MIAFFTWVPYNERHKLLSRLDGRDEYVEEYKMNCYEAEYRAKRVTVEEALDSLRDGDVIGTSQCANEPTAIFPGDDRPRHALRPARRGQRPWHRSRYRRVHFASCSSRC